MTEVQKAYVEEARASFDANWSKIYRQMDEGDANPDSPFTHYGDRIERLSAGFGRPIDVLDAGCGTGRYFHRVRNARVLVGLDLSPHMIEEARSPLRSERIDAGRVELLVGEIETAALPAGGFDFIYSVGVYGEYAPFDAALLAAFARLLRPGGLLFVTAVDAASRISVPENDPPSLLRRVLRKGWWHIPEGLRIAMNRRLSPFYVSRAHADAVLRGSGLRDIDVQPYVHKLGWLGTHWDCVARKP